MLQNLLSPSSKPVEVMLVPKLRPRLVLRIDESDAATGNRLLGRITTFPVRDITAGELISDLASDYILEERGLTEDQARTILTPSWLYLRSRLVCEYDGDVLTCTRSGATAGTTSRYGDDLNTTRPLVFADMDDSMRAFNKFTGATPFSSFESWGYGNRGENVLVMAANGTVLAATAAEYLAGWDGAPPSAAEVASALETFGDWDPDDPLERSLQFEYLPTDLRPSSPYDAASKVSPAKLMRRLEQEIADLANPTEMLGQLLTAVGYLHSD